MPQLPQRRATELMRSEVRRIRDEAKFGGGFDIPEDIGPIEVIEEELRRSLGFVRWIEMQIAKEYPNALVALGVTRYDDNGKPTTLPTEEQAWLTLWGAERDRMLRTAKIAVDCGISERQIQLAESQSEQMFAILDAAFNALELTAAQRHRIPIVLPAIIRGVALPPASSVES